MSPKVHAGFNTIRQSIVFDQLEHKDMHITTCSDNANACLNQFKTLYHPRLQKPRSNIILPSRPRHPRHPTFKASFLMPRVCFKPVTWYIEMHQVRTLCVMTFSCYVMFIHNLFIFKSKDYRGIFLQSNCQYGRCL